MDDYDRCTNLGKQILPIVLPSVVEAENILKHPLDQMIVKMLYFCDNELLFSGWNTANFGSGN